MADPILLTWEDVRARAKGQIADSYLQFASLVKGGSVVVAAAVFLDIFRFLPDEWRTERVFFLVVTVLYSLLPVVTYRRGVILATPPLLFWDYLWPLVMGFTEIAAFTAIGADVRDQEYLAGDYDFRLYWCWAIAGNALAAVFLVSTRWAASTPDRYEQALRPLVDQYRDWLDADRRGAAIIAFVMMGSLILIASFSDYRWLGTPIGRVDTLWIIVAVLGAISVAICGLSISQYNQLVKMAENSDNDRQSPAH